MGGISGGSSKSGSKPKLLAEQKASYRYLFSEVMPQAQGKDTFMTNIMAQNARDEGAAQGSQQMQQQQQALAVQGGGGSQIAALLKAQQDQSLQETFKQITQNRQATALNALSMIAGMPLTAGQQSKSSSVQGGVSVGSSRRFKKNIKKLEEDWNKALQLKPKSFIYKDDFAEIEQIGYIAEEVDKLGLRGLVVYDDDGKPEALNYHLLSVYAIEILKDQEKRIKTLEKKLGGDV